MASSKTQRKLTAILCAYVVGYSRLMGGFIWEMPGYRLFPTPVLSIRTTMIG